MHFFFVIFVSLGVSAAATPISNARKCGYEACHPLKSGSVNVHIVPHTHDDVGWLKTVDQYYYGSNTQTQNAGVQYILDTVVMSLVKNPNRRFIYVETAFFWKWWLKQHDITKAKVRKLVKNGQLEFVGGGWTMNDEAATHYQSIIDQMTWGLRKLNETFGECGHPKVGWQIDPFGHSKEMANIFAQLGFDGVLLGRIDYQEKLYRWETRTAEMVWRGSESLEEASDIFTGVLFNNYSPPPGFCFDLLCSDEPFIDDKKSFEYNVDQKVDDFIKYLDKASKVYTSDNILITMGEDFNYQDAEAWFINLDKLIYYVNQRQENGSVYNLFYSTPACYVKAVNDNATKWPLKRDDFFPYASDPHSFWTGYFTSRPTVKRFERYGNNYLQVCKQLYALADLNPEDRADLNVLREAMGVMQHHDAITGTEQQHVANDYARHLQRGLDECDIVVQASINKLSNSAATLQTCHLLNISQCDSTTNGNESFIVTLYNPLSRDVDRTVRLPVLGGKQFRVTDQGQELATQLIPIPDFVKNIPGRSGSADYELVFRARNLPPFGWKSFVVVPGRGNVIKKPQNEAMATNFTIDPQTGLLASIQINNISIPIDQNFFYYEGFVGDNAAFENRSSGAYIFRPAGPALPITHKVNFTFHKGPVLTELHQTFNEFVSQIIRLDPNENYVEFDWIIGPLPHDRKNGIEVITKYGTNFSTNGEFYTDSNGKQALKRIRNYRPTWNLNLSEPESGNYYPIAKQISILDEKSDLELAVLVDRAQGGSSLVDGQLELMLHRLCLHDDAFGVGEALNETAFGKGLVVRGSHYVTLGTKNGTNGQEIGVVAKDIAQRKLLDAWTFITSSTNEENGNITMEYSGLQKSLPKNVQILTLEPWIGFSLLLRLEHIFEKNEHEIWSQPAEVSLKNLFTSFQIVSMEETTLGANQWLKDSQKLRFSTSGSMENLKDKKVNFNSYFETKLWSERNVYKRPVKRQTIIEARDDELTVELQPGQIRTFVIEIKLNTK